MIGVQFVLAVLMYFGTFIAYYLPIRLFGKTVNNRAADGLNSQLKLSSLDGFDAEERQRKIYSNCNCIATGIFIAMSFMNLPIVQEEFRNFFKEADLLGQVNFPVAEFTILLGFFMVLFFEQLVIKFRSQRSSPPFLHLDEETNDDEQHCKLLEPSSSSEGILIDQNGADSCAELENRSESGEQTGNDVAFKSKDQFTKKFSSSQSSSHHEHFHHSDFHHHHGDFHHHFDLNELNNELNLGFFMLIFASSIHSIFEGLALGLIKQYGKAINLFIGIFLHECIVAVALGINAAKVNKGIMFGLVFSGTIPLGIFLGVLLGYTPGVIGKLISSVFQGLATGRFDLDQWNSSILISNPFFPHHSRHLPTGGIL